MMDWREDEIYDYVSGQLSEDARVRLENDASQSKKLRRQIHDFRTIYEALDVEREGARIMSKTIKEAVLSDIRRRNQETS